MRKIKVSVQIINIDNEVRLKYNKNRSQWTEIYTANVW